VDEIFYGLFGSKRNAIEAGANTTNFLEPRVYCPTPEGGTSRAPAFFLGAVACRFEQTSRLSRGLFCGLPTVTTGDTFHLGHSRWRSVRTGKQVLSLSLLQGFFPLSTDAQEASHADTLGFILHLPMNELRRLLGTWLGTHYFFRLRNAASANCCAVYFCECENNATPPLSTQECWRSIAAGSARHKITTESYQGKRLDEIGV
jgi:hypothetical protein